MKEGRVERSLMSQEEFKDYMANNTIQNFEAVNRFKSINRAIKRLHVTPIGVIIPNRPFNNKGNTSNRKNTHSKKTNELKKIFYGKFKEYQRKSFN